MSILPLTGEWRLTYLGEDGEWGRWIKATVPGDVHLDLMNAGLISEPLEGDNNLTQEWIEEKIWRYKKTFYAEKGLAGERIELVCDGLDLTAKIWVNGILVGESNNMFVQHRFDVTEAVREGENEIIIDIDAGFHRVKGKAVEKFSHSWNHYDLRRPWMRKAQQCFYWDVAPRLVTCGIWRDIRLEFHCGVLISDVHTVSTVNNGTAEVCTECEVDVLSDGEYRIKVAIADEVQHCEWNYTEWLKRGIHNISAVQQLEECALWWPNGLGEQHLYNMSVTVLDREGRSLDTYSFRHGIRRIDILKETLGGNEETFTFAVNGVKVFCKGGNWVPSDAVYGRINRDKEEILLRLARDANFNMIRVWGGGVYPDTYFYDLCDEMGIMVWQDFMYACGYYPDDEQEFLDNAVAEAHKIVKKFRNHASLALWCGNNENHMMNSKLKQPENFAGKKLFDEILPQICKNLDPKTYYHNSSPYPGPWPENAHLSGDQHVWSYTLGWRDIKNGKPPVYPADEIDTVMNLWAYPNKNHKFVSEFGFYGPSNRSSVRKFMGRYPAVIDSPIYNHHRNYFEDDFINEMLRRFYKKRDSYSPEEFTAAGQMLQGEILKYILEEFRSRMYVCSGTLFWEYNDTWGHVGYAPVDYYLSIKPVYYYMKEAFAPLHAVWKKNQGRLVLINDRKEQQSVDLEYGILSFDGEHLISRKRTVEVLPGTVTDIDDLSKEIGGLACPERAFAYVKLYQEGILFERNREFLVDIPKLQIPENTMQYRLDKVTEKLWRISFYAEKFTWMVKIDCDQEVNEYNSAFDLWPGESRQIEIRTMEASDDLELDISNINMFV